MNSIILEYQKTPNSFVNALSSCKNFLEFLHTDQEIQYLAKQAKHLPSPPSHCAYHRWFIVWLKVESAALYCFYRVINYLNGYLIHHFPSITILQVKIKHRIFQNEKLNIQNIFKKTLLVHSINAHQPQHSDFYLHPPVNLRVRTFEKDQYKTGSLVRRNFFMPNGICDGMCIWFTYLYFKTLPFYPDSETQLQTIAKLFENGAPRQAELIQLISNCSFGENKMCESILGLEMQKNDSQLSLNKNLFSIKAMNENKSSHLFNDLSIGVYSVLLVLDEDGYGFASNAHALRYFKINEKLGFIWDPNVGLIKLAGSHHQKELVEKLLNCAGLIKSVNENSYFKFQQIIQEKESVKQQYTLNVE